MTSTLILYTDCDILPERNFKVDDIANYLLTLEDTTISDFQYIKQALNLTIKISSTQADLEMLQANNVNYCSIQNGTDGVLTYYFILSKKWLSESCIELTLSMDTINTFADRITLSDRTKILRQHKDRFEIVENSTYAEIPIETTISSFQVNTLYEIEMSGAVRPFRDEYEVSFNSQVAELYIFSNTLQLLEKKLIKKLTYIQSRSLAKSFYIELGSGAIEYYRGEAGGNKYALKVNDTDYTANQNIYYHFNNTIIVSVISSSILPKIDFYSEGLHPVLFQTKSEVLKDWYALGDGASLENNSFYLIYKTRTTGDDVPVDVYCCADNEMSISPASNDKRNGTLNCIEGYRYFVPYSNNNDDGSISFRQKGDYLPTTIQITADNSTVIFITATRSFFQQKVIYNLYIYNYGGTSWSLRNSYEMENNEIVYTDIEEIRYGYQLNLPASYSDIGTYGDNYFENSPIVGTQISSIRALDRTNSQIIKVIKIPYFPTAISKDEDGKYLIDENTWEIGSDVGFTFLKLKDLNYVFEKTINYYGDNPYQEAFATPRNYVRSRIAKSIDTEVKLFHSDFYQWKLVYDSFSFNFNLEEMNVNNLPTIPNITFKMTKTMNSRFLFCMNEYQPIRTQENYYNIMNVVRNNEIALYNSPYLNYIRTGYNYDVKTKQRNTILSVIGTTAQTIGGITSLGASLTRLSSAKSYGDRDKSIIGSVMGIGAGVSAVSSIIGTINSIAQSEQDLQQKVLQNKMEAVSVEGSDDIDLLTFYADNNKCSFKKYEVSPKLKQALYDLFYHQGYIADHFGLPDTTSRVNFNFVSAEIVFAKTPNLPSDIVEDIRQKYGVGITFLHKWENQWDFSQQYENWEVGVIPLPPTPPEENE